MALSHALRRLTATAVVAATLAAALTGGAVVAAGPAAAASDAVIAKAGTIVQSDLGPEWSGGKQDESGNKLALKAAADYPECKDYLLLSRFNKAQPNAASKDWTLDAQSISNKAYVYKNVAAASKAMTLATSSGMADCLTNTFQSVLGDQLAGSSDAANVAKFNVVINEVPNLPTTGDDIVGYSGGVQITYKDGSVEQLITGTAIVRVGRALLAYTFSAPPTATDYTTALDAAIANTVTRTAKAQK